VLAQVSDIITPEQFTVLAVVLASLPAVAFLTRWGLYGRVQASRRWKVLAGYYVLLAGCLGVAFLPIAEQWFCLFLVVLAVSPIISVFLTFPL